jgi:hypothetical protein
MSTLGYAASMEIVPKETQFQETIDGYASGMTFLLSDIARECQSINKTPKAASRNARLLEAIQETFELIGGVPRMAIWADGEPGEFYKLLGKQIPGMVQQLNFNGPTQINIQPALPRSALDGPDQEDEACSVSGG